jgi:stage V sporulation protein B
MNRVYKTAVMVTIFSLMEKFLGFIYRIYLSRAIGSEGVGLYQITLSVFALLLTLCSSGIPATVSRLITKYRAEKQFTRVNKVATAGFLITLSIALPVTIIIFIFPKTFAFLFADERCLKLFLVVLPALSINAVYSVLRGIFWGNKDFLPYSVIELIEETVMIVAGIVLVYNATSVLNGANRALIAVAISYVASFTLGVMLFLYRGGKIKKPIAELKPLMLSSIPITAMRTAGSIAGSIISVILPAMLIKSGLSASMATSKFGAFFGMAMPLISSPMSLIGPFTVVLIPQIAESFYKNDKKALSTDIEKSLNITIFLTALTVPVFFCFGEDFGIMLFSSYEGGVYTSRSAYLTILLALSSISTSILNSIGKEVESLITFLISTCFLVFCILFLPRFIGIYALLVGYTLLYGISTILNLVIIAKKTGVRLKTGGFAFYSVIFMIPSAILGILLKKLLINVLGSLFTAIVVSLLILAFNGLFYIVTGLIDYKDLFKRLPNLKNFKLTKRANKRKRFFIINQKPQQ